MKRTCNYQRDIDLVKWVHLYGFYGLGRTPENVMLWQAALNRLGAQLDLDTLFRKWDTRDMESRAPQMVS